MLAEPPAELRLVFSEPLDASLLDVDLLDEDDEPIATDLGSIDPADDHALVAPLPSLEDGVYTVSWRVLSAADGHVTQGFITFGIGAVDVPGVADGGGAGGLHVGQAPPIAVLDALSRAASYAGTLLAFGLPIIAWLVIAPALRSLPRRLVSLSAAALAVAGGGAAGQLVVGAMSVGSAGGVLAYATDSRSGMLLSARLILAIAAAALAAMLLRRDHRAAAITAGSAAGISIILVAASGHAAAGGVGPVIADAAHLGAAGTWTSGLAGLMALVVGWLGRVPPDALRAAVPRFSALALVSIGLVVLTGVYASWLQVGDTRQLATPYGWALIAKVVVVGAALGLGAVNYVDGGRMLRLGGGLRRRVMVELGLAGLVILVTANLTTGIPPAQVPTVALPVASGDAGFELALQPGRPGPNRAIVVAPPPGVHVGSLELVLERLDTGAGTNRLPLRQDPATAHGYGFLAEGVLLPAGSRWTASTILRDADGAEVSRTRYSFLVGPDAVEVATGFTLGPGLVVGGVMGAAGIAAIGFWMGGGSLPRTERRLGRRALVVGGAVALALAFAIIGLGPL